MPDQQPLPSSSGASDAQSRLHEVAQLLRSTHHLGPQTQEALAELADELAGAFAQGPAHLATSAPVMDSIAHVAEALHRGENEGPLNAARTRLLKLATEAESQAPNAAAFARRFLDALANIGI